MGGCIETFHSEIKIKNNFLNRVGMEKVLKFELAIQFLFNVFIVLSLRNSHREAFFEYPWQSLFFNKVSGLGPATLLHARLWHRSFLVNFVKFIRTSFFTEHLRWLLLIINSFFNLFHPWAYHFLSRIHIIAFFPITSFTYQRNLCYFNYRGPLLINHMQYLEL